LSGGGRARPNLRPKRMSGCAKEKKLHNDWRVGDVHRKMYEVAKGLTLKIGRKPNLKVKNKG